MIATKSALHITFDENGAEYFKEQLNKLLEKAALRIDFNEKKEYRGKQLNGLFFEIVEEGEYVYFRDALFHLEIEREMVDEFIWFIENALRNGGFSTPEVISFRAKREKDVPLTICCFLEK